MNRIDILKINNFKFFQAQDPIELGGNHLLLYGENGSGKSSVYWALYTLFEASLKAKDDDIKKYFSKVIKKKDSLLNIHALETGVGTDNYNSFIEVITDDATPVNYKIAVDEVTIRGNKKAQEVNYASDFINYRLLMGLSSFRHSDDIDLFEMFVEDIFKYVQFAKVEITRDGKKESFTNAFEIWQQIEKGLELVDSVNSKTPRKILAYKNSEPYNEFTKLLETFNASLQTKIDYINIHGKEYFKKLGYEIPYSLQLETPASFYKGDKDYRAIPFVLRIKIDEYEGLPNVIDKPHSFLNEAKLSALAISIRLAILSEKLKEDCLKFIVLDDLLISLDMRNREKVLDLLLSPEFSDNYQLLILTHDRMFYQIAKHSIKNLGQDKWVYYEMFEDVLNGKKLPHIKTEETYLGKARNQFYVHKDHEAAGNYMRKEAEAFCKDFLPKKLHYERKTFGELDLCGKLQACKKFADDNGLAKTLFEKLDSHRKFIFNALSHDSYDVPLFKSDLEISFETFKEIAKLKFKTVFLPETKLHFELSDGTDVWRYDIDLYDEFKLIKEDGKDSILSLGMINYYVYKVGDAKPKNPQHKRQSIKAMYDYAYNKSDKTKNADFWEEVFISSDNSLLKTIRTF